MANQADEERPEFEEGEGGPVKSFLEHLEDFRWMLIKCCAAIAVMMMICLLGTPYVIRVLTWPLDRAKIGWNKADRRVTLQLGTNHLATFKVGTNQLGDLAFGTNQHYVLQLEPVTIGTNRLVALRTVALEAEDAKGDPLKLINLGPGGVFMLAFKVAIYAGIFLASPFLIYFIGQFVLPALRLKEKKYLLRGFCAGLFLFTLGLSFCYFLLMPVALKAAVQFSAWLGFNADQWRAEEYISFVCMFMLGMGIGFQLPIVILILHRLGIVTYKMLAGFRRYMIVINLILGAVLTTPEVVTQVLMFIPLQALYEMTIWIAWYWERQERKRTEAAGED
jgi:sec-independent protein translocase protein TatC